MRQKSPIASDKAKPKMAYEKICCFSDGFLAQPIISDPNTNPMPIPEIWELLGLDLKIIWFYQGSMKFVLVKVIKKQFYRSFYMTSAKLLLYMLQAYCKL